MTDTRDTCIFHITTPAAVAAAHQVGEFRAPSLESEGFIHFSRAHQVHGVVEAFYRGQSGLVLMLVDPALLNAPLKYEAPSSMPGESGPAKGGAMQLFPHLYGALNMDAVLDTIEVSRFVNGDTQYMPAGFAS